MNRKQRRLDAKSRPSGTVGAEPARDQRLVDELSALFDLFGRGYLAEAEAGALDLKARLPREPLAWRLLGTIYTVQGRNTDAILALKRSVRLAPDDFDALNSLGVNYQATGNQTDALASFSAAVSINPLCAEAHSNLGMTLQSLGRSQEAVASCQEAITIKPDYAEGYNNLAIAQLSLGRFSEALEYASRAVELRPNYVDALTNLALLLHQTHKHLEAIEKLIEISALRPLDGKLLTQYGDALHGAGQYEEAIVKYYESIDQNHLPHLNYYNISICLQALKRFREAKETALKSIEIDPTFADGFNKLGNIYRLTGRSTDAVEAYRRAVELNPKFTVAHSSMMFAMQYCDHFSKEERYAAAIKFGESLPPIAYSHDRGRGSEPKTRLRIGCVSPDLRVHPVAYFIENILSVLSARHPSRLETVLYSTSPGEDHVSERLRAVSDRWNAVAGLSDAALARKIYDDEVDILIDLSGHTAQHRLAMFALKPAPIQASWFAYFATTGVPAMDYFLCDPCVAPPSEDAFFTEKLWRMPVNVTFTVPEFDIPVENLPVRSNGYITFGCFNHRSKLTPGVVALWAQILQMIPTSRLFLKSGVYEDLAERTEIIEAFGEQGVGVDRLIFEGLSSREEYLACYNRVDLCLDPFPYTGGTTTLEAMWMGKPVLTMKGDSFLSRIGETIAQHVGAFDWIAEDQEDYLAKAVAYTSNIEQLTAVSSTLRDRVLASRLFDAVAMAGYFEDAMWGMWAARPQGAIELAADPLSSTR